MPHPGSSIRSAAAEVLACAILLSTVFACCGQQSLEQPTIDINDYFQLPADMVNNFDLIRHVEKNQEATTFARISKNGKSWTTHNERRSVTIPTTTTELSFSYHNLETGTITKVQDTYQTVADTVYLEHLHSVAHVECDHNSRLTITYNTDVPVSSRGLRFGLKRAHFLEYTKVAGGQSFFCPSSCAMGTTISRNVVAVISHSEDPVTGLLSSITIETSMAPKELLYHTVADYFINGSFALLPQNRLLVHSKSNRLNWHGYLRKVNEASKAFKLKSTEAKLRAEQCQQGDVLCTEIAGGKVEVRYKKTIDLFNFNFDSTKGKAAKSFISLFGTGAPSTTETVGNGIVFGCDNCYAYAGVSFIFKVAMSMSLDDGLTINYVQLQVSGKLLGNFNLVAIIPTPSSGTRLMYQKADDSMHTMDGKSAFTNQLGSFNENANLNTGSAIMPNFPNDAKTLFSLNLGSITLKAYMALAIEVAVTGTNVFTAQAGAYASADMTVGLFLFEKVTGTCTTSKVFSTAECNTVVSAAGTDETKIGSCTAPTTTTTNGKTTSGRCINSKYLVIQVVDGPNVISGLNGPSLKADKKEGLNVTISIYPIAKITAYDGIFALYASPKLTAAVEAKTGQTGCSDGVQIQAPVIHIAQVFAWFDIVIDLKKWLTSACVIPACVQSMGMQAPLLLKTPIAITLPSFVNKLFPLCAAVAASTPSMGRLVAAADVPSSLILGSSVTVNGSVVENKATASFFAESGVFPAGAEIIASSGQSAVVLGSTVRTTFSITAQKSDNTAITALETGKVYSFKVDFSGKASVSTTSIHLPDKSPTISREQFQSKSMKVRSTQSLVFCPKPISDCASSDWTAQTCSGTCSISGTTVTESGSTKLGSYALVDSVVGNTNQSPSSGSSATISLVLCLVVTALAHLCI